MEIIVYEERQKLLEDLKYWSNALGELHHRGEFDIKESGLPEELQHAYRKLWTAGSGSLCYLAEYKGRYGIVLINEFSEEYADNHFLTMDGLFCKLKEKAEAFQRMETFQCTTAILGRLSGFEDCHEFIIFFPADTGREEFDRAAELLCVDVYRL